MGGGAATLTLPHLNKDDEGLYTVRIWSKKGTAEHSAYLFVKGKGRASPHPTHRMCRLRVRARARVRVSKSVGVNLLAIYVQII